MMHRMLSHAFFITSNGLMIRYLITGSTNTLFSYLIYCVGTFIGFTIPVASFFSILLGILFSFKTHGMFVFMDNSGKGLHKYILFWSVMYILYNVIIYNLVGRGVSYYLAGLLVSGIMSIVSFFVLRDFVYDRKY